jgi:hypothetical protein
VIPERQPRQPPLPRPLARAEELRLHETPGRLRFATDRLPWQRSLRWTGPPRDRRLILLGLLLALALTIVELVGFGIGMHDQIAREVTPPRPRTVEVVLIEPPPDMPIPPEPEPPPFVPRQSKVRVEAPKVELPPPPQAAPEDSDAMRARMGTSGPGGGAPQLFNSDGSIRLAPSSSAPARPLNQQEAGKQRWAEMEKRGDNPLDCKRTRFARAFKPDQSLGDEVSSKYLKWIGLADGEAIGHRAEKREERAAEGCDPIK